MKEPAVTAFSETAALYAVLNDDRDDAVRIIENMLPGERAMFAVQLDWLQGLLTDRFGNDRGTRD